MAHNLKLNIWSLKFYDKTNKKDKTHLSVKEALDKLYISKDSVTDKDKNELFKSFIEQYVQSFDDKFINDKDVTKAFTYDDIKILLDSNVIYGSTKGGITGIQQDVFNINTKEDTDKKIFFDEVSTLPYFFYLWLPVDSDIAYLMSQSYTSVSINKVFLEHLVSIFNIHDIRIEKQSFVTEERMKYFYKNSFVYKVSVFKSRISRSARKKFNEAFMDEEKLKMNLTFSGFKTPVRSFFSKWSSIKSNLKDLNIESEDDYDIRVYYEDVNGRKASASMKNPKVILPSINIPNTVKENDYDFPNPAKILTFCNSELDVIKKEIKYNPLK